MLNFDSTEDKDQNESDIKAATFGPVEESKDEQEPDNLRISNRLEEESKEVLQPESHKLTKKLTMMSSIDSTLRESNETS